ncbi:MAG TPA: GNAT family N-acetyltransferase [Thermoanaerobaculia bacterium]
MGVVRRASAGDVEEVAACLRAAFAPYREQYTDGAYADTVPDLNGVAARLASMVVFVAEDDDGAVVGTIGGASSGGEGHIRGMAVLPRAQGSGVAARLLAAVEAALRERGCSIVSLDTTMPLARAIRFYERSGYRASGRVVDFFGMPLYEYRKRLEGGSP